MAATAGNEFQPGDFDRVVTTVSGKPITTRDVVTYFKGTGAFRNAVYQLIGLEVVRQACAEHGIAIEPAELDAHAEQRRAELGLRDAVSMNNYCRWLGITFEQWLQSVEDDLAKQKLARRVITDALIDEHLAQHSTQLRTVTLARAVCEDGAAAARVRAAVEVEGRDFCAVAREQSIEESTRAAGGYLGNVTKGLLPPAIDAAVFAATEECLLGPFEENGHWTLYQVLRIRDAARDDATLARIRVQLFANWLDEQVKKARA